MRHQGLGLPMMVIKENGVKACRWRCVADWRGSEHRGWCRTCLKGTQQRNEGAVEAPEGKRSVEVKRARQGSEGGERRRDDARESEVLCLRHGSRLREAGEDTQHGSILSQETLVHPPQALDLSQSRESLHRGGQRDTERGRQRRHARRRDMCREKRVIPKENAGTHLHTTHRRKQHVFQQDLYKKGGILRGKRRNNMQTKIFLKPVLLDCVLIKRHGVALKCHSIRCFSKARALKFMETRLT